MKQTGKKLLSLVLAAVMVFTLGVTGVTAHTFVPAGAVTRAQIAVILARYQGVAA